MFRVNTYNTMPTIVGSNYVNRIWKCKHMSCLTVNNYMCELLFLHLQISRNNQ